MKKSPLQRRGQSSGSGLSDWLDYSAIAEAGKPRNLTGEAIVQLGALFTQIFPDDLIEFGKTPEIKADAVVPETREDLTKKLTDNIKTGGLDPKTDLFAAKEHITLESSHSGVFEKKRKSDPPSGLGGDENFSFNTFENIGLNPLGIGIDGNFTSHTPIGLDLGPTPEQKTSQRQYLSRGGFVPGGPPRLKPEVLEILKKLSYTRKGDDDTPLFRVAHVATSPFTKTDTDEAGNKIGYRYMRRAVIPEYAQGSLGTAAADGYNLAIDKYNYNRAVEEDFENLLVEETKGLDIDVDYAGADFQADYLQAVQGIKKDVSNAVIDYAQGKISKIELEAFRTKSKARVQRFAAAGNQLKNLRADYIDKIEKGLIDPKASQGEHTDLFNTLYKAPDNLTVKTIDGVDYVVGKTLQNQDIKVAVSKIADGSTGLGVIPKADINSLVATAKASIKAATKEGRTAYGVGAIGASLEEAERISKEIFEAKLRNDETFLRGAVSTLAGIDYDTYEAATEGPEKDAELEAMIQDTAQAIFNQGIKPGYTQQTRTTRFRTEGTGSTTAGERKIAQIKANFDKLGNITENNYKEFLILVPGFEENFESKIKDGRLLIGKGKDLILDIDLSNPILAKQQLANLAGVTGYSGQQQSTNIKDPLGLGI